jgi:3-oxoacyl-[acyl-carrier protein] reductase
VTMSTERGSRARVKRPVGGAAPVLTGSAGRSGWRRRNQMAAATAPRTNGAARASSRSGMARETTAPGGYAPTMDLGLEGRVALVTGASRGIGFGIASALAAEGARVAISSPTRERIESAAGKIGARPYIHDITDLDAAPHLVEEVGRDLGAIDVLVTNTGGPAGGDPLEFTREQWQDAHRELMLGPIALIEAVLPGMRARRFGRILNISSSAAREPIPNLMMSSAHRSGMLATFKTLARRVAADGITLNSILPGRIATERIEHLYGSIEEAEKVAREEVSAGRLGTAEEIAAAAAFLCSEPASYVTGQALLVDGGLTRSY